MRKMWITHKGFTLIELLATLAIFGIVSTMMFGTFDIVSKQVGSISAQNSLADKGQRILSFMEEDIRMIAYLLGPDALIPYCNGANDGQGGSGTLSATSPVISFTSGSPYDSLSFITSVPVGLKETTACKSLFTPGSGAQKDCAGGDNTSAGNQDRIDYYLTTQCEATAGGTSLFADAGAGCIDDLALGSSASKNGRSLVTFDSLLLSASAVVGSSPQVYYSLSGAPGSTLTFSEALQQNIPDGSTIYNVRMYRYIVDTSADSTAGHSGNKRNLKRVGWDANCSIGADVTVNLVDTSNNTNVSGGVDGLKFEFVIIDSITGQLVTAASPPASLNDLKAIRVWLLLRADKPDNSYTDKGSYALGTTTTLGPYNDHYRRLLINKTVEVKNLARIY